MKQIRNKNRKKTGSKSEENRKKEEAKMACSQLGTRHFFPFSAPPFSEMTRRKSTYKFPVIDRFSSAAGAGHPCSDTS